MFHSLRFLNDRITFDDYKVKIKTYVKNCFLEKETNYDNFIYHYFDFLVKHKNKILKDMESTTFVFKKDTKENLRTMIDKLTSYKKKSTYDHTNNNTYLKELNISYEKIYDISFCIISSVREMYCDLAMIDLADMNIEEYLITYTKIQSDLLIFPSELLDNQAQIIRFGLVIDYLLGTDLSYPEIINKLENIKDNFLNLYLGYYFQCSKYLENTEHLHFKKRKGENWFQLYKRMYKKYYGRYKIYTPIIKNLNLTTTLKNRNNATLKQFTTTYKCLNFKDYIQSIKKFGEQLGNLQNHSFNKKKSLLNTSKLKLEKKIFELNISLIHMFFYQNEKLSDLYNKNTNNQTYNMTTDPTSSICPVIFPNINYNYLEQATVDL